MSESSGNWDAYFARVERYLDTHSLESDELGYKRETAQELGEYRDELLAQQMPISIRPNGNLKNLGGFLKFPDVLKWLSTGDGTDALLDLWARFDGQRTTEGPPVDKVIERIRRFSARLPKEVLSGPGTRMRPISVLLMALGVDEFPVFMTTIFKSAYESTGFEEPPKDAKEADLYAHALTFCDWFIAEASKRGLERPSNRLEAQSLVWALRQDRDSKPPKKPEKTGDGAELPDSDRAGLLRVLADRLLLPAKSLQSIETLLRDKRQVIFQGPPGTGKTFVARALAKCLAGAKERVRLVQFHPSYSYEDFVQGFRPTLRAGQPGFELRNGPLVEAAEQAKAEPEEKHFLVIDEINRGNLAKVFGELYFLLEYRDDELRLLYSDEPFVLPENLYIIGTMNTADRSIALVDLALRRRFHFVEFHPDKPPVQELLRRWLMQEAPGMTWVADVVERANAKLDDRQAAIGPSYFMKPDLDHDRVRLIWEHNVRPYVEEHLYGEYERIAEFELDRLRGEIDGNGPDPGEAGEDDPGAPNDAGN